MLMTKQTRKIFSVGLPLPRKRPSSDSSPSCWNSMFANMDDHSVVYYSAPEIMSEERARADFDLKDMQMHLEQIRIQIADCELIRDTATDKAERELFEKFLQHFKVLATKVERAIAVE